MQDVETKAQRKCKEGNTDCNADCTLDKPEGEGMKGNLKDVKTFRSKETF